MNRWHAKAKLASFWEESVRWTITHACGMIGLASAGHVSLPRR